LAVALGLLLVFPAAAGAFAADERPRPRVALAACSTGATDDERFGVFTASMPALRGTVRTAMRFPLRERTPGSRWTRVRAAGFGRWERSDPGRAGFVYTKRVERMRRVADYRVVVRFRWEQADGTRRRRVRRSPVCRQPDPRPDLELASVT